MSTEPYTPIPMPFVDLDDLLIAAQYENADEQGRSWVERIVQEIGYSWRTGEMMQHGQNLMGWTPLTYVLSVDVRIGATLTPYRTEERMALWNAVDPEHVEMHSSAMLDEVVAFFLRDIGAHLVRTWVALVEAQSEDRA